VGNWPVCGIAVALIAELIQAKAPEHQHACTQAVARIYTQERRWLVAHRTPTGPALVSCRWKRITIIHAGGYEKVGWRYLEASGCQEVMKWLRNCRGPPLIR